MCANPTQLDPRRWLWTLLLLLAACGGAEASEGPGQPGGSGGSGQGGSGGSGEGGSGQGGTGGHGGTAPDLPEIVFAHTASTLFQVGTATFRISEVGPFLWRDRTGAPSNDEMTDIAIDAAGNMTGISFTKVWRVDPATATCDELGDLDRSFNGLSWVGDERRPEAPERLVAAALDGSVYELDPRTGASTPLGSYGGVGSSGDLFYVRGLGTFATVSGLGTDHLARIDPTTFTATVIGDTGFANIWGVSFWGDRAYGFTDGGQYVHIDVLTGAGTEVESGGPAWWGAGVTTTAPVILQ